MIMGLAREGCVMPRTIHTDDAPAAVGPYSQATTDEHVVCTAGQIALTPDGDDLTDRSLEEQTVQCLSNLEAVLAAEGLDFTDVLKTTIYLDDIDDYAAVNEIYAEYFTESPPARSAVAVDALPKGAAVEIEVIASTR